jgi:hypothetical protein
LGDPEVEAVLANQAAAAEKKGRHWSDTRDLAIDEVVNMGLRASEEPGNLSDR